MDEFQSAYRALHSTETALINVMGDFLNFKDSNCPIQILLLDLSAAFDTLDHSIYEKRLLGLGIEKLALNWILSYIKERTFSVKISEHYSTPRFLNTGIPQGSVLGPLLFLIYIKPLSNIIKKFSGIKCHIYADDIIIYTALSNNSNTIFNELSPCANAINRWLIANKLLLNKSKTVLLNIPSNNSVKYLGIIIDRELNMNEQITSVCRKTNSSLYRIRKIRKYLTKHITIILIKSLALSHLDYCSSIYHVLTHKATRNIHRIIRRSVRLIFRQRNTDHSSVTKRMQEVGILDIQKRSRYRILSIIHKVLHKKRPRYLLKKLNFKLYRRTLRSTTDCNVLTSKRTRLQITSSRAFSVVAPLLWNALSRNLRAVENHKKFKKELLNCA